MMNDKRLYLIPYDNFVNYARLVALPGHFAHPIQTSVRASLAGLYDGGRRDSAIQTAVEFSCERSKP